MRENGAVENVVHGRYYLWDEIQQFISDGSSETEVPLRLREIRCREFNSEECCLIAGDNANNSDAERSRDGTLFLRPAQMAA